MPTQVTRSGTHAKAGAALVGMGLAMFAMMMAFPERLHVPAPIGHVVAGTFVLGGLLALANVFCSRRTRAWLAVALLLSMLLPAAWIALGAGPRSCSVGLGSPWGLAGGSACRVAFGVAAIFGLAVLLVALRHALKGGEDER